MPEKEPTQPKIDEKTQQRLSEIDAELYVFKQKAKGDAKTNLKLVEMERAKELILEKRELLRDKLEGRNAKEFLDLFFKRIKSEAGIDLKKDWSWALSVDADLVNLKVYENTTKAEEVLIPQLIDQDNAEVEFRYGGSYKGVDMLYNMLKQTDVITIRNKSNTAFYLKMVDKKDQFDDEPTEITQKDWEETKQGLYFYRRGYGGAPFAEHAQCLKILRPKEDLELNKEDWLEMGIKLKDFRRTGDWFDLAKQAANMKVLDYNRNLDLTSADELSIAKQLDEYRKAENWGKFTKLALAMKIVDSTWDLKIGSAEWTGMWQHLEYLSQVHEWSKYASQAATMKILGPAIGINIPLAAWQGFKETLHKDRNRSNSDLSLAKMARDIKILKAKAVKVTNKGLIIMD